LVVGTEASEFVERPDSEPSDRRLVEPFGFGVVDAEFEVEEVFPPQIKPVLLAVLVDRRDEMPEPMLRPLPFPEPDRLVQISRTFPTDEAQSLDAIRILAVADHANSFEALAATGPASVDTG